MQQGETTTQERILEASRQEFMENGFAAASLRTIAQRAGVTTGAIYGYYSDKDALFCALVEGPAEELYHRFLGWQQRFDGFSPAQKALDMESYTISAQEDVLDYIYGHLDAFRLLISCSAGTRYEGYVDRLVEIEEQYTMRFAQSARRAEGAPALTRDVVHIVCSACYHGLFEIIAHNFPRQEALAHIRVLTDFYRAGWQKVMGL